MSEEKKTLTKAELVAKFYEQIEKIKELCELYDSGKVHFAQDIALKLRVLFHQPEHKNTRTKALVKTLEVDHILMVDSRFPDVIENADGTQSHMIGAGGGLQGLSTFSISLKDGKPNIEIKPRLSPLLPDEIRNTVPFLSWWTSQKIISPIDTSTKNVEKHFYRKDIVMELADSDGGAHVDTTLDAKYYYLRKNGFKATSYQTRATGEQSKIIHETSPVYPAIRQIAYEVIESYAGIDISEVSKYTDAK